MGAQYFVTVGYGKTANAAFRQAKEQAYYDHGHNGYTGSLAEKPGFMMHTLPPGVPATTKSLWELETDQDKWSDAFCVKGETPYTWLFWGWASS